MSAPTPAPQALFRASALQARTRIHDRPLRLRAPALHLLALLLLVATLTGGVWIARQPYTEKLNVTGFAQRAQGRTLVRAPVAAVVAEVAVSEGSQVAPGAVLLRLSTDVTLADGRSNAASRLKALEEEERALAQSLDLSRQRHAHAQQQLDEKDRELLALRGHLQRELRAARAQRDLDRRQLADVEALLAQGAIAAAERLRFQRQLLVSERLVLAAVRSLTEHDSERRQHQANRHSLEQTYAQSVADLQAASARLQQRRIDAQMSGERLVRAPVAGVVSGLHVRKGQRLQPGQQLLNLLAPGSAANVVLLLPSDAMGAVAVGQTVRVRYAGYPYAKYGMPEGRITRFSETPVRGADLEYPVNPGASLYVAQVQVTADTDAIAAERFDPAAVAPGMQLEADVLVRSDPIWRRAMEPFIRFWHKA